MTSSESTQFDFDGPDDGWLEKIREAEAPRSLGKIGPYDLIDEIGRGGQGVVFKARQPGTRRVIALKRMLAGSFASHAMRLRFEREIETASALQHPNIVSIYGMESVDGLPILAMEWVDGISITDWASGKRTDQGEEEVQSESQGDGEGEGSAPPDPSVRRSPTQILEQFLRVCDAMMHAHAKGILHRDLKPANILVDDSGQPHVLDFGLAKRLFSSEESLTRSSGFVGTPSYSAPEQILSDDGPPDERSDIYSLGVLLYEMLTGRLPFKPWDNLAEWVRSAEREDPARPSSFDPRLLGPIDTIVLRAMAKERDLRYPNIEALCTDLRRAITGEPILSEPVSGMYLLRRLVRRNRLAVAFFLTVTAMVFAFGVVATIQREKTADERDGAILARQEAQTQREKAEQVLAFFLNDVLMALDPKNPLHRADLAGIIESASDEVHARFGDEPSIEAEALRTLGELARSQGQYDLAVRLLRRTRELHASLGAEAVGDATKSSLSLARVLVRTGALEEARLLLTELVEPPPGGGQLPPGVLSVALSDLSVLLFRTREYDESERRAKSAIQAQSELYGPDHAYVGISWLNLSRTHLKQQQYEAALDAAQRAEAILRDALVANHPLLAQVELRLGAAHAYSEDSSDAEGHFRAALAMQRSSLGDGHPDLTNTKHEFAVYLISQEQFDEGIPLFAEALEDLIKQHGPDNPQVVTLTEQLAQHREAAQSTDG